LSETAPERETPAPPRRRRRGQRWAALAIVALVGLVAVAAIVLRYGVLTPGGRGLVTSTLDGLNLAGYGRLHVEGLEGDAWRDFTVRRLTISDDNGTWLDARAVRMRWDWPQLLSRRFAVNELDARLMTVLRAPLVKRTAPGGGASVTVDVQRLSARVELLPAFSTRYGLYDVDGAFQLRRQGGLAGRLAAASQTHAGDRLDATFDLGRDKTIRLALNAREAQGGAMAGALGLAADKPFLVDASATGTTSQGRFQVASRSGDLTPIQAQGAWTPQSGQADGRIALAASRLLSGYQHMLGPELRFQVNGAKAADGLEALNVTANSDNADVVARGEADIGRQIVGPKGLAVGMAMRQFNRVVGWPPMGGARFAGTFTGKLDHGLVAGQIALDAPNAWGYRLARASGPAKLGWGGWDGGTTMVQASLGGEGGAGAGLFAALLGGRPRLAGEVVWLSDGRMLVKSVNVAGPGLTVTGAGSSGIFGGLSFKGQASFSNFALVHPGAKGLMTTGWTASQSGKNPWGFTFDANAKSFASGYADLDRLLGPAPALKGQAIWNGRAFAVSKADLTGAAGAASAGGTVGGDGALALKVNWQAKGPLDVGPLEISGAADGSGAITGSFGNPRADLAANFAVIDLPQLRLTDAHVTLSFLKGPADTNGAFTLAAGSPYGPAKAQTGFRFQGDGIDFTGLDVDAGGAHAAGQAALRRGAPSSADLAVSVGPGAFLERGAASGHLTITQGGAGGAHASLKLVATDALAKVGGLLVDKASLTADGPLAAMPYRISASGYTSHGSWRADGSGELDGEAPLYGATFSGGGRLRGVDFKTLQPAALRFTDRERSLTLLADVGGGRADVNVHQAGDSLQAKAALTDVGLGLLDQDFAGRFDADLTLSGEGEHLGGQMDAKLTGAGERGAGGAQGIDGVVKAVLAGNAMTVDAQLGTGQGLSSHAHLVLPALASAAPFHIALVRTQPMHGDFAADGEIKPLWTLIMGGERSLSGAVHATGTLSGTIADPQARGAASISGGAFTDAASGLKLANVTLAAQLDQTSIDVSSVSGQDGVGGSVSGQGRISLERSGVSSFRLDLNRFRLIDNDTATATASGQATINRGADGAVKLTGALTIDRADVAANPPTPSGVTPMDVVEVHRTPGTGGHPQAQSDHAPAVALDVALKAPRAVFLKGRGLNLELSLDAHVTGTTETPSLDGTAQVVRGDFDFAGKRFQFDSRGLVYLSTDAAKLRLDLTATRDDPSLTAVIRIEGTAAKPRITLTSTPVLPADEVLSQVLFGSSASQLSPLDAATLASAAASLAGGAGFDITANLRSFAHLDRLTFGGDTPGAIVSGGKYVTNNVYVEIAGSPTGPAGYVEWRVRKNLSVVSRLGGGPTVSPANQTPINTSNDSQIEIRWRKDY
jgi:translocation and assembly module TamB